MNFFLRSISKLLISTTTNTINTTIKIKHYPQGYSIYKNLSTSIPPPRKMSKIVWMDLEMTGLNVRNDKIMEVVCAITDNDLNLLAEGPKLVIHQPDSLLNNMDEWCTTTHTKTGLLEQCRTSNRTIVEAEEEILDFLKNNNIKSKESPLAGNSIYMDRLFIKEYMPTLDQYLHYRLIDVSTCKELCKRWNSKLFSQATEKKLVHRGYEDIMESIEELKYYKQFMFQEK